MYGYYYEVGVRIPNDDLGKMLEFHSVTMDIINPGFKNKFTEYKKATAFKFKLKSNVLLINISFLRVLFEKCLNVDIDNLSFTLISYDIFLEKKNINVDSIEHSDDIKDCIDMIQSYQKKLKNIKIKGFDYELFKDGGDDFIEQLIVAHKSPKTDLENSDYMFFSYLEEGTIATLKKLQNDEVN